MHVEGVVSRLHELKRRVHERLIEVENQRNLHNPGENAVRRHGGAARGRGRRARGRSAGRGGGTPLGSRASFSGGGSGRGPWVLAGFS